MVCDNYSHDKGEASELVCKEVKKLFPELKLYFNKQYLKVGITQTRHELIMKSTSEIIVFADDDYLAKPYLLNAIQSFKDKSIAIVTGPLQPNLKLIHQNGLNTLPTKLKMVTTTDLTVIDFGEKRI